MNPIKTYVAVYFLALHILSGSQSLSQEPDAASPLSPDEAAETMLVPDGFRVTLLAGEPDVQQPIGFCIDDRGRLWVAKAYNYRDGSGTPEEDAAGGGHAHCGTMVCRGDSWPDQYRNTVLMHNLHGHRINNDILRRAGSGYSASHGRDLLRAKDNWYMGVTMQYGTHGSVYSGDWSDTGECHSVVNTQRGTGRIYKIRYGEPRNSQVDLQHLSDQKLVAIQRHRNDWFVRHARRILQERAADSREMAAVGHANSDFLVSLLNDESEYVRAWAIRLLSDRLPRPDSALHRFAEVARTDPSSFVGMHLASALQRMDHSDRWPLAESLSTRTDFAADQTIPLMIWCGIEPLVNIDPARFISLAVRTEIPLLCRHFARRTAKMPGTSSGINLLVKAQAESRTADRKSDLLDGILKDLEGTRGVPMLMEWPSSHEVLRKSGDPSALERAMRLALIFDDANAIRALVDQAHNRQATNMDRQRAIEALAAKRVPGFDADLLTLTRDEAIRREALRGLAQDNHPDTVATILAVYPRVEDAAQQDALQTLAARPARARAMLDAVKSLQIPRKDITAFTARQLHSLGDKQLSADAELLWGHFRETPKDRIRIISEYKPRLTPDAVSSSNRSHGRTLVAKTCGNCHRLFDAGLAIGPDLTGAQRTNIDDLLLNLIDPSSSISKDFQMQIIETRDGRTVTGLVVAEGENAVTIQTPNDKVVIPADEIEQRVASGVCMMPKGMLQRLTPDEVCDLFAYLTGPDQVSELR